MENADYELSLSDCMIDEEGIPNEPFVQRTDSSTRSDVIYKEMEEKSYMIRSEDLKCNEDIL
jgi:hypothetical protein